MRCAGLALAGCGRPRARSRAGTDRHGLVGSGIRSRHGRRHCRRPSRACTASDAAAGRLRGHGFAGEGLHYRGRHLPGRPVAAVHGSIHPAADFPLPRFAPGEPVALPLFPRLARLCGGGIEPGNPRACAQWRGHGPPDRRNAPARQDCRGRSRGRTIPARRSEGAGRASHAAGPGAQ